VHVQEEQHLRAKEAEVALLTDRLVLLQSQVEASSNLQQEDLHVIRAKEEEVKKLQHKVGTTPWSWL